MGTLQNILEGRNEGENGGISEMDCISWWLYNCLTTKCDYSRMLSKFRVPFTYNNNAIENITIPLELTESIFNGAARPKGMKESDAMAIRNHKVIMFQMVQELKNEISLSNELVQLYHSMLMTSCYTDEAWQKGEKPGAYRKCDMCVGMTDVGSAAGDVVDEMTSLLTEMDEAKIESIQDRFIAAAYFHLKFENIHPFYDGNGRVGRLLLNYFLIQYGLPPIIVFDADKAYYYLCLELFDNTGDIDSFIKFMKMEMIKTWKSSIEKYM